MLKRKPKSIVVLILFLLTLGSFSVSAKDLSLIKGGKSLAGIVLPENPSLTEKYAAEELSGYARKKTGTAIPVYNGTKKLPAGVLPITFSLKNTGKAFAQKDAAIKDDGFAIFAQAGKGLHIRGARPRSLLYAVYHILKSNGILFLYPHPEGKGDYIPAGANLVFPEGTFVKNPAFSFRKMTLNGGSLHNQHCYEWFLRNGLQLHIFGVNQKPDVLKLDPIPFTGGHVLAEVLVGSGKGTFQERQEALMKAKPELFGLVNGKRTKAGNAKGCCQPCTSNPETKERMLKNIQAILARFKGRENIRTFCNDDHIIWCECENCKKLDDPKAPKDNRHADRWWHFINYMAKNILTDKNPNQKMKVLAYQTFRYPPRTIKPDPRVLVEICPHYRCYIHPLTDPTCTINATMFRRMFEDWAARTKSISTFEYHTQMPGSTRYLPMERAWIKDMRYYKSLGIAGFGFITRAAYSDFGHLNSLTNLHMWMSLWQQHYMTGFLAWNIDADAEKEMEKINAAFYGKAWKEMKPYRAELEKALYAPGNHMKYGSNDMVLAQCLDKPGLEAKLVSYLKKAQLLVKDSPIHLERVKQEEFFFNESWVRSYRVYEAIRHSQTKVNMRTKSIRIDGKLDEEDWKKAEIIKQFIVNTRHQEIAKPATRARMVFDNNNIYFAIECMKAPGKDPIPSPGDGIPAAMRGSHVEIFLAPPFMRNRYYHFGVSRNGKKFAALTINSQNRNEKISVPFQYGITEEKDKWTVEIRFPLVEPFTRLYGGEEWRINVGRSAVAPNDKIQASSWSGGIFHGAHHYRNIIFGEKVFVRNGGMEILTKPPKMVKPAKVKEDWIFKSGTVPAEWRFGVYNPGTVEVLSNDAAAGKNFIRVTGVNAFIGQDLKVDKEKREFLLTAKVRGKGEICSRLFGHKMREGFTKKIDTKGKWEVLSGTIKASVPVLSLWFRITGTMDIDDVVLVPVTSPDDYMPTADKHK